MQGGGRVGEPLRVKALARQVMNDIEMGPYFQYCDGLLPDWVLKTEIQNGDMNKVAEWLDKEVAETAQAFYDAMNVSAEMLKREEYRNTIIRIMKPENRNCLRGEKAELRKRLDFLARMKQLVNDRLTKKGVSKHAAS